VCCMCNKVFYGSSQICDETYYHVVFATYSLFNHHDVFCSKECIEGFIDQNAAVITLALSKA
jgi:hypothetical protein